MLGNCMLKKKNVIFLLLLAIFFVFGNKITSAEYERDNKNVFLPHKETETYANFCTGFYLMLEHRWEDAIEFFIQALKSSQQPERIHNCLATCYLQIDKKDEAIVQVEKVAQLKPDDFGIHYMLGNLYENEGEEKKAIFEYERAESCITENISKVFVADMLYRLSDIYLKNKELEKAVNVYEKILDTKLTNEPVKLHYRLGQINFEMERVREAIAEFTKARNYDSDFESISFYLALCYEELEDYDNAIAELSSFIKDQSDNWRVRISLSNLYEKKQQYDKVELEREKAFEILKRNIKEGSQDLREYIALSQLLQRNGENEHAIETLETAVSNIINNNDEHNDALVEIRLMMANVYYDMNDPNSVVRELREVLQIAPDCHQASNFLGFYFVERGEKLVEALGLIEKALSFEPENGAYLDSLGWAYYKLATKNDNEKIMLGLQKLIEASEYIEDPEIMAHIGDVNYSLGFWDEAQNQWEIALKQMKKGPKNSTLDLPHRSIRELNAIKSVQKKLEKLQYLKMVEDPTEKLRSEKRVVSSNI